MTDEERIKKNVRMARDELQTAREGLVEILVGEAGRDTVEDVQSSVIRAEMLMREIPEEYL